MNINSTSNISDTYIQSLLNNTSVTGQPNASGTAIGSTPLTGLQNDNSQLSPLAQLLSTLQQLQQQNPSQYQQVTAQIAANLQAAANTAQSDGNASQAGRLNQLASDFQTASQTGQLPDIKDLAASTAGHHHHHHHHAGSGSNANPTTDPSDPSDPLSIVQNTLANGQNTVTNG